MLIFYKTEQKSSACDRKKVVTNHIELRLTCLNLLPSSLHTQCCFKIAEPCVLLPHHYQWQTWPEGDDHCHHHYCQLFVCYRCLCSKLKDFAPVSTCFHFSHFGFSDSIQLVNLVSHVWVLFIFSMSALLVHFPPPSALILQGAVQVRQHDVLHLHSVTRGPGQLNKVPFNDCSWPPDPNCPRYALPSFRLYHQPPADGGLPGLMPMEGEGKINRNDP